MLKAGSLLSTIEGMHLQLPKRFIAKSKLGYDNLHQNHPICILMPVFLPI